MSEPLQLIDVDDFAKAGRVPESAINDDIIASVKSLDERKQLEVWIQEIVHSFDETPHGPTEIADIISTRISVRGKPTYTAFILKGRATPKLASRHVAHQYMKLRTLQGLELAVLVAVGDIQDDAYRDFVNTAKDMHCNYLIISKIDLSRLLIAYDKICSQDGLPFEEGECPNGHKQSKEITLNYKVRENVKAEILKLRDVSHGNAKRLSAIVLTDQHYNRDTLREVVVSVGESLKNDAYVRSEIVRARWGNSPPHVLWVYIGSDLENIERCNWICSACWISSDLDQAFHPGYPKYDEVYEGIMIEWNNSFEEMKALYSQNRASKGEVIDCVENTLDKVNFILLPLMEKFVSYNNGESKEEDLVTFVKENRLKAQELYRLGSDCPVGPVECSDYRQRFIEIVGLFGDLFIFYSSEKFLNREPSNRKWLFQKQIGHLEAALRNLEYEAEKLNS